MPYHFVCFVTLVIKGGAMVKFWPLHHCDSDYNQCMERIGEETPNTILHRWWEWVGVNLIISPEIADGMN